MSWQGTERKAALATRQKGHQRMFSRLPLNTRRSVLPKEATSKVPSEALKESPPTGRQTEPQTKSSRTVLRGSDPPSRFHHVRSQSSFRVTVMIAIAVAVETTEAYLHLASQSPLTMNHGLSKRTKATQVNGSKEPEGLQGEEDLPDADQVEVLHFLLEAEPTSPPQPNASHPSSPIQLPPPPTLRA